MVLLVHGSLQCYDIFCLEVLNMTFKFNNVYVNNVSTVTGPYEKEGPLGKKFDKCYDDLYFEEKSWEKAESKLFEESIDILLNKSKKALWGRILPYLQIKVTIRVYIYGLPLLPTIHKELRWQSL